LTEFGFYLIFFNRTVLISYSPEIIINGEDIVKSFSSRKAAEIGLLFFLVYCLFHDNVVQCPKRSGDRIYLDPHMYFSLIREETEATMKFAETHLKALLENVDAMKAKLVCVINTFCISLNN